MGLDADRIARRLGRHKEFADLADDDAGADLCKIAADGCAASLAAEADPDGNPLAELAPSTVAQKGHDRIGYRYGLMSDPAEMAGEVAVSSDKATVTYGVSDDARQEAAWFIRGDPAANRPPRNFWGLTPDSIRRSTDYLARRLRSKL